MAVCVRQQCLSDVVQTDTIGVRQITTYVIHVEFKPWAVGDIEELISKIIPSHARFLGPDVQSPDCS